MNRVFRILVCAVMALFVAQRVEAQELPKTLRFMDFNVADGMWYDQYNNYDSFVLWMNARHIDIFAICEAATHWDKDKNNLPKGDDVRYLPGKWGELAKRWGHEYAAVGPYQDNYPVALTSRYPIEVVQRIGGPKVSHGALHAKVCGVNIVVLHLWPQQYRKGDPTRTKGKGGDEYRMEEINHILEQTILNPQYADEEYWIMTGDFNTRSPIDKPFYDVIYRKNPQTFNYDVQTRVREVYPHDVMYEKNPDALQSSTRGKARIDYIYCSKKLYPLIRTANTIRDDFVRTSSDHCPLVIEFKTPKIKAKK